MKLNSSFLSLSLSNKWLVLCVANRCHLCVVSRCLLHLALRPPAGLAHEEDFQCYFSTLLLFLENTNLISVSTLIPNYYVINK